MRGPLVQVNGKLLQSRLALSFGVVLFFAIHSTFRSLRVGFAILGNTVRDEIDHIKAAHALFSQQVHRMGVLFRKHGNQHVERGDLLLAGRLHVIDRALQDALE